MVCDNEGPSVNQELMGMSMSNRNSVTRRIDRLEASTLVLRWAVVSLLLMFGAAAMVAVSHSAPKVVEAEAFQLRDAKGKLRGAFAVSDDGKCSLVLADSEGRRRIIIGEVGTGLAIVMMSSDGGKLFDLSTSGKLLSMRLGDGRTGEFSISASSDGSVMLQMRNNAGSETLFAFTDRLIVNADGKQYEWPGP